MGIFARIVKNFIRKPIIDERSEFIFYRIIDSSEDNQNYLIQCMNTHGTFYASLKDIIADPNILYSLHPIQACYIGIEHIQSSEKSVRDCVLPELESRYGLYQLSYIDRKHGVGFFNKKTDEEFLMPSEKIIFSEQIIEEFDAIEAFYIGTLAGVSLKKPLPIQQTYEPPKKVIPHLRVIRGKK